LGGCAGGVFVFAVLLAALYARALCAPSRRSVVVLLKGWVVLKEGRKTLCTGYAQVMHRVVNRLCTARSAGLWSYAQELCTGSLI
jgi:hypothetical protein